MMQYESPMICYAHRSVLPLQAKMPLISAPAAPAVKPAPSQVLSPSKRIASMQNVMDGVASQQPAQQTCVASDAV